MRVARFPLAVALDAEDGAPRDGVVTTPSADAPIYAPRIRSIIAAAENEKGNDNDPAAVVVTAKNVTETVVHSKILLETESQ
jgi:hypothetical protein